MLFNNNDNRKPEIPYERIRQFVYKFIRKRVSSNEDAEDITQNVIFRGWKSNEKNSDRLKFESETDYLKYFRVIAANEIKRYQAEKLKMAGKNESEDILFLLPADQLNPDICLGFIQEISQLPIKQRLAFILGERMLLISFQKVFSTETIAEFLDINETLLEKLANEIPLSGEDIKYVIETIIKNRLKTSVPDERWKAKNFLKGIFSRD